MKWLGWQKRRVRDAVYNDGFPFKYMRVQGSVLDFKSPYRFRVRVILGKRGEITQFSRKSRNRLLKKIFSYDLSKALFWTLTYSENMVDVGRFKEDSQNFFLRLKRRGFCGIWRVEFQERGAFHLHLLFIGVDYIPKHFIDSLWANGFTWVERIPVNDSRKLILFYVSKYMAKPAVTNQKNFRYWGVFNKKALDKYEKECILYTVFDNDIKEVLNAFGVESLPFFAVGFDPKILSNLGYGVQDNEKVV